MCSLYESLGIFILTCIVVSDLRECPGIEPHGPLSLNLTPVLMALKHDVYFRSLTLVKVSRKEVLPLVAEICKTNHTLTKLVIVDTDAESSCAYKRKTLSLSIPLTLITFLHFSIGGAGCCTKIQQQYARSYMTQTSDRKPNVDILLN